MSGVGAGPRPLPWASGAKIGNDIASLCVCLVGGRAKSVEETRISNAARLHYLHAEQTHTQKHNLFHNIDLILFLLGHAHTTHTRTLGTHDPGHKKAVVKNFLKFSAGFFMAFPVVALRPWHYHEYFCPSVLCAFDTFPFADLKRTFHSALFSSALLLFPLFRFSDFPFSARLGQTLRLERGNRNYVFMLACAVSNICSSIPYRLLGSNHQMGRRM